MIKHYKDKNNKRDLLKNIQYRCLNACILLLIMLLCKSSLYSQGQGDKIIKNYTAKEYKSDIQNWAIIQDRNGIMYFGNANGALKYDGTNWEIISLPTYSVARSFDIDSSGRVYVGSVGELGYLEPDSIGKMEYISLINKIDEQDRGFKDVWSLHCIDNDVWFSTYKTIFRLRDGKFKTWKTQNNFWKFVETNKHVYIFESSEGIKEFAGDSLTLIPFGDFFKDMGYVLLLPFENNQLLVLTGNSGLYTYDFNETKFGNKNQIIKKFPTEADTLFYTKRPYSCIQLSNGNIAIGVIAGGVVILNNKGRLIRHIHENNGLISNMVTSLFEDKENNLWVTSISGITKTEINSPISFWSKKDGLENYIVDLLRFEDKFYIANYNGIFCLDENKFKQLQGLSSPCFYLLDFKIPDDTSKHILLGGTNFHGVVQVINNKVSVILTGHTEIFQLYQSKINPSYLFIGESGGLTVAEYKNNKWLTLGNIKNINIQVRSIFEDKNGNIWLSNQGNKIIEIIPSENILVPRQIKEYTTNNKGSFLTIINSLNNHLVFGNETGLFCLNEDSNKFVTDTTFSEDFYNGSTGIINIQEDKTGSKWIAGIKEEKICISTPIKNGKYKWYGIPFKSLPEMQIITSYFESDSTIWIVGTDGLFRFKGNLEKHCPEYPAMISKVIVNNDSVIYYGQSDSTEIQDNNIKLPFSLNSIIFKYTATTYYDESRTMYQTYLEGFDKGWSGWRTESRRDYTNLYEGHYTMHVRAKNIYEIISSEVTYSFTITPPWYRTALAYIIYILFFGLFVWFIVFLNAKRLKAINLELEETVKERTKDLHEVNTVLEEKQAELEVQQEEIIAQRDYAQEQKRIIGIQNKELAKLSIVASKTDNAVIIADRNGKIEWLNEGFTRLYGYTLKDLYKSGLNNFTDLSKATNISEIINSCLKSKKSKIYESLNHSKSGQDIWAQTTITPIFGKGRNIVKLIAIDSDISRLKLAESEIIYKNKEINTQKEELEIHRNHLEQLVKERTAELEAAKIHAEESDRLKSAFLANMSHEIRTPMNAIIGFTDLLNDPDLTDETKQELTQLISYNSDSLLRLVDDIIDISRIESNQLVIEIKECHVENVYDQLVPLFNEKKQEFRKNQIEILTDIPDNEKKLIINTDPFRLRQVLTNLMDNALKFTEKGKIETGYRKNRNGKRHEVIFFVKDTGIGLSDEQKEIIFNRFSKIEDNKKKLYRGAGLGLAISKSIIELLGGEIWVESELGKGTSFYFSIPLNNI